MAPSSRELELLREALPSYEIGGELGRGAFGIVYQARHRDLGREVAVKQLPRAFAADPSVRERFVAEAQMVARLDHPHIVPVYDFVNRDDGMCLIIMERCNGAISDRFNTEGLATDEACAALLACCAALDFAHAAGVLHRDIKPENLLYDTKGVIKLGDFGIARALDASIRRTATGTVIGTPAYMSPEQVRGEDLTAASDVYSVGIMAYELLTGGFPFDESNSATGLLAHHLVTPPRPLIEARAELPAGIGEVIDRSLSKDVGERQASAEEFALELTAACVGSFGAGWLRRRRFVLHWPEVIAESERPRDDGARTGTIVVKADESRALLAGAKGLPSDRQTADPIVPPAPPVSAPAGVAPSPANPTVAPVGQQPSSPSAPTVAGTAQPPVSELPPPSAPATSGNNNMKVLAIIGVVVALVGIVAFVATRGGGDDTAGPEPTTGETDGTGDDGSDGGAGDGVTGDDGTTETDDGAPTDDGNVTGDDGQSGIDFSAGTPGAVRRDPTLPVIVDSPFAPTPCPSEADRVACIIAVGVDEEEGIIIASYEVFGFEPELEPAGYHLHFYLDTLVDGDERKAGAGQPGATWKPWDGFQPFSTFGGENGRTGYSVAEVIEAGARNLCVIVADPDQVAIPATGNCAPIPLTNDVDLALEQVDRLTGVYAGECEIGVTLILPSEWRWLNLVANDAAAAARILRPGDVATAEPLFENLIASGGLLWADGPVDEDFIVNLNVLRVEGAFTASDTADEVRQRLAQSGLVLEGTVTEKTFFGRPVISQVVQNETFDLTQYVIPDFGYALLLQFASPNAARWMETSDAIAATVMGC